MAKKLTKSMQIMNVAAATGLAIGVVALFVSEAFGYKVVMKFGIFAVLVLWIIAICAWVSSLRSK